MTETWGRPNGKLRYAASGYRDIGCARGSRRYNFVITGDGGVPYDEDLEKLLRRKRTTPLTYDMRGSRMADVRSDTPCARCGPWVSSLAQDGLPPFPATARDKCKPADFASHEVGARIMDGYLELRPYMLLFDRFEDGTPHIGYWNITDANWKKWKLEKGDRDIMSLKGTVQKTDGLSARSLNLSYMDNVLPTNGRAIPDTKWFKLLDSNDLREKSSWACCNYYEGQASNIRIHRVERPQLRNQQIGNSIRYRRSRDFWFAMYAAQPDRHSGFGRFVGMLSSENMSDEFLDPFLRRVITPAWSSFNELKIK
jgi:hypothetical protein